MSLVLSMCLLLLLFVVAGVSLRCHWHCIVGVGLGGRGTTFGLPTMHSCAVTPAVCRVGCIKYSVATATVLHHLLVVVELGSGSWQRLHFACLT